MPFIVQVRKNKIGSFHAGLTAIKFMVCAAVWDHPGKAVWGQEGELGAPGV